MPQMVQLSCPNCRAPIQAQVFTLVDAGRQPELKARLLMGQLNVGACANCGYPVMIAAPLIYHDQAKQLFLVHFPQQINARPEEQERFVGEATSALLRTLPPGAPRGYLLAPRRFLTLTSLVDAVLEADGMTRADLEAELRHVQLVSLVSYLAEAQQHGEETLRAAVEQLKDQLDYSFFAALTELAEAGARDGQQESAELLLNLREKLLQLTGLDGTAGGGAGAPTPATDGEAALDRLLAASDEELEAALEELDAPIEDILEALERRVAEAERAGDAAGAARLEQRRAAIKELEERLTREGQALYEAAAAALQEAMDADDPRESLRRHSATLDGKAGEAFAFLLENHLAMAQRSGRQDLVERLTALRKLADEVREEALTPEDRLINQLLHAETPQAATSLLRQNTSMVTTAFVRRLNERAAEEEQRGNKPTADRLRQLGREAGAMLF